MTIQSFYNLADGNGADNMGDSVTCPNCGHSGSRGDFGIDGAGLDKSPEALRTPAPNDNQGASGNRPQSVRGASSGNMGLANEPAGTLDFASRRAVSGILDVIIGRGPDGRASVRHRAGGQEIGTIGKNETGAWQAMMDGQPLSPHGHQRPALLELLGSWNKTSLTSQHPAGPAAPLQPRPVQTPLMERMGIPAIAAQLATPTVGTSDGPRVTTAAGSSDPDDGKSSGLTPKGMAIKKKLMAKGWPDAKADMFAKRAQSFGGGGK
jgi:hypothetical protein